MLYHIQGQPSTFYCDKVTGLPQFYVLMDDDQLRVGRQETEQAEVYFVRLKG